MRKTVLGDRNIAILWSGQAISELGDKLTYVALPILALQSAGGDLRIYALVMVATMLPNIAFGWLVGALVDWLDRRKLMGIVEFGRCLCVAAMALRPGVEVLLALVLVYATFTLIFKPAMSAAVPALVPPARIVRTQALMESTGRVIDIFGFIAAGAVTLAVGVGAALQIDAATFIISALTLLQLPLAIPRGEGGKGLGSQVREGFTYQRRNMLVRDSLWLLLALTLGIGVYNTLIVPAMGSVLHQPLAFYGYWMAVQSAGAAAGSYLVTVRPRWLSRRGLMLGSLLLLGALAAYIGRNANLEVAFGLAFLFGFANMGYNVTIVTWLQESVPGGMLGRVFALRQMGGGLFVTLGTLAAGAWGARLGVGAMISLTGIFFVLVGVGGFTLPGLKARAAAAAAEA